MTYKNLNSVSIIIGIMLILNCGLRPHSVLGNDIFVYETE